MIRNVVIMVTTSGLVLFSKTFLDGGKITQPKFRLVGSVITSLLFYAQQTTGMGLRYMELSNTAITIATDDVSNVFCALFHDLEDGVIIGRLLCSEILNAFTQEYSSDLITLEKDSRVKHLKDFQAFEKKFLNQSTFLSCNLIFFCTLLNFLSHLGANS